MYLRMFDIFFSLLGLLVGLPLICILCGGGFFDTGSPLFYQERVGRYLKPFILIKFRTMRVGSAQIATHLASPDFVTTYGQFLRRTKLDELPQLWNVLKGDMSLVGPRPCLTSQKDLIVERFERDVFSVRPGITGLSQIDGIDMSTPRLLAETDALMLRKLNISTYIYYILKTITGSGRGDRVRFE